MPFHVEISRGMRRARAFNLSDGAMRSSVLEPWVAGRPIDLGDQEWTPGESSLRILEGPVLAAPDLAYGQGWHHAERLATDVTRQLVDAQLVPTVAVHAEEPDLHQAVKDAVERLGWTAVPWAAAENGEATFALCVLDDDADPLVTFALGAGVALERERVIVLSASELRRGERTVDALAAQLSAVSGKREPQTSPGPRAEPRGSGS